MRDMFISYRKKTFRVERSEILPPFLRKETTHQTFTLSDWDLWTSDCPGVRVFTDYYEYDYGNYQVRIFICNEER